MLGDEQAAPPSSACLLPCEQHDPGAYECRGGDRRFCDVESAVSCAVCGCADGSFCDDQDDRCHAHVHADDACERDIECLSARCLDGAGTSGPGDECRESCDGTCGGPPDALYCMPACVAGRCPTDLPMWECLATAQDPSAMFCGRVCRNAADCLREDHVCEPFEASETEPKVERSFTGYCLQPR